MKYSRNITRSTYLEMQGNIRYIKIANLIKCILLSCSVLALSGCLGTMVTRGNTKKHDAFGAYPYTAVVWDIQNGEGPGMIMFATIDLVVDTIFLPIDMIAWPLGYTKSRDISLEREDLDDQKQEKNLKKIAFRIS